jgi:BMFP domain-containing protein YqiC
MSVPRYGPHFQVVLWKMRLVFYAWLRYQIVMTDESIENIARKLAEAVPEGLRSVRDDMESNFRSVLRASLAKLDLVTREEFDVQEAVLAKTRAKLEALEERLTELEKS